MNDTPPQEQTPDANPTEEARWRLVAIVPGAGAAPAASLSEREARAAWAVTSALWHPLLLSHAAVLPSIVAPDALGPSDPHDQRITAREFALPDDEHTLTVEGALPRTQIVREVMVQIAADETAPSDDAFAADFLALGTTYFMLLDLTRGMGHSDVIDHASLLREVQGGTRAWLASDGNGVRSHLRAAFEVLTQGRERVYPVDDYLLDLLLFDASEPELESLSAYLTEHVPCTLIATGHAVERLGKSHGATLAHVREGIEQGWLDVAGGPFDEVPEPLLPVESILWQYLRGSRAYQAILDGRNVETFARRGFALYPMLPQVLRRFGVRYGYHLALDGGRFPIPREAKRLWEAPDGSSVEVLARPPLSAHSDVAGREFPWRLARTLKEDHVATLPLVHRTGEGESWFRDLRRAHALSPVFGRWVTLGDYFQRTDRPWEPFRPTSDEYESPYLSQALSAGRTELISWTAQHARLRANLYQARWLNAIGQFLGPSTSTTDDPLDSIEEQVESRQGDATATLQALTAQEASRLASVIVGTNPGERPGYLVINTLSTSRRCPVMLPDAAADLGAEGPLKASQFTDEGVWGVVELPALGFAWIPAEPSETRTQTAPSLRADGYALTNGIVHVELDPKTGGVRGIKRPDEPSPRIAQQIMLLGARGPSGHEVGTQMIADRVEVEYGGPALAQAVATGRVADAAQPDRTFARFRQRVRLWWGRPSVEFSIELLDIDTNILESMSMGDPWTHAIVCRWAWADAGSTVRRGALLGLEATRSQRIEAPELIEISNRGQRTAVLTGGLAFHSRHGTRMLDTHLVAGREQQRRFELAVSLDLEYPAHATLDFVTPPFVVPTANGPPHVGPAGWLLHLDMPSVAMTRVEAIRVPEVNDAQGLAIHLLETAGRSARGRLRLFRRPTSAWLADQQGERIIDLEVQDDAILIDLTPRELARIEVLLTSDVA